MQFTYRNPARSTDPGRILAGAAAMVVGAWPYGPGPGKRHGENGGNGGRAAVAGAGAGAGGGAGAGAGGDRGNGGHNETEPGGGRGRPKGQVARYARHDHYEDLRNALNQLADVLTDAGWRARVVADDNALVDRAAAQRAGLGWFGKNSNILLPGRGSWFLLGSIVTDAPLPPSEQVSDGCGSCRRCLTACPTGALVAPGVLDARKCLAWLVQATGVFPFEYRVALEGRIYGCDDCQEICPANRLVARTATISDEPGPGSADEDADVDLLDLLGSDDESLMSRYGRWYIPERDPRYLRRNALVALGNVADGSLPEVAATLSRYLDHADDMLRAHAAWAAFRSGRQDLLARRPHLWEDPSPIVQDELARLSEVPVRSTFTEH
jgi:epoxyqueuosine reductase